MSQRYRGIVLANNRQQAHNGLDRMHGLLEVVKTGPAGYKDWLIVTRDNFRNVARGCLVPNRILVFDLSPQAIPDELWECLVPCLMRENGEQLNITYISRQRRRTDLIDTHRFTVRRQDGIGPHPPELPCVTCGLRADQHRAVPIAAAAQEMVW